MISTLKKLSVMLSRQEPRKEVNEVHGHNTLLIMKRNERSSEYILSKSFLKDGTGNDMNHICLLALD